jgi:hypothetical protein
MNPKRELRVKIAVLAAECEADAARYSQATASILFCVAAALSEDTEEELMHHVAPFAQNQLRRLTANRN